MGSKYTKRYTEEFKRDAIALVDSSGRTVTAGARELGVSSESLRGWYRRAKADRDEVGSGELTCAEREELKRLRKEVREQQRRRALAGGRGEGKHGVSGLEFADKFGGGPVFPFYLPHGDRVGGDGLARDHLP
ncbi:hypothetical protein Sm713_50440 [Streptomyces sp. TS71-3]|nr:hypothetical protein Sm713_50440 [Streptomyces sp. TS71-3]